MVSRPPFLVSLDAFMAGDHLPRNLLDYAFRIGEGGEAGIDQLPNLRTMAFYLGALGSKRTTANRAARLQEHFGMSDDDVHRIMKGNFEELLA